MVNFVLSFFYPFCEKGETLPTAYKGIVCVNLCWENNLAISSFLFLFCFVLSISDCVPWLRLSFFFSMYDLTLSRFGCDLRFCFTYFQQFSFFTVFSLFTFRLGWKRVLARFHSMFTTSLIFLRLEDNISGS